MDMQTCTTSKSNKKWLYLDPFYIFVAKIPLSCTFCFCSIFKSMQVLSTYSAWTKKKSTYATFYRPTNYLEPLV
ncbi:hypothetical protein VNO77_18996 [Canavalia gladiata]|uniref:Uncharacterized protein n=1 Tax=Canavalia gladiata TaxID=3824 RepID=A0AAN9QK45_CANGL